MATEETKKIEDNKEEFNLQKEVSEMRQEMNDFFDVYLKNEQFVENCSIKLEF